MKRVTLTSVIAALTAAAVSTTFAGINYWDPNGATVVTTGTVNGSWENTSWATSSTPTASTVAFTEGNLPGFVAHAGTLVINATYNVTANANHTVGGLFNGALSDGCVTNLQLNGTGILNIATGVQGFEVGTSGNMTVNSVLGGAGTLEWQGGGGSLYLWGNNTYSGGTYLKTANGLNFNNNNSFGTGLVTNEATTTVLATPATDGGGTANGASGPLTIANAMNTYGAGAGTLIFVGIPAVPVTWTGAWHIKNASGTTATFQNQPAGTTFTIAGNIDGAGNFTKAGAGTLVLSGSANTYTGNTTVSAGFLKQGAANTVPFGTGKGTFAVSSGATFDLNGFDSSVNGFGTSAGTIDNTGGGSVTLTIGNNNGGGTHSGVIQNTTGTLNLVKTGTGTITINNAANSYTGKTTINGGTITFQSSDNCLGAAPGSFVADQLTLNGGTLNLGSTATATIVPNRGITLGNSGGAITTSKNLDVQTVISGAGSLTRSTGASGVNLTLSGANTFSGGLTINQARVDFNNNSAAGTGPTITVNPTANVILGSSAGSAITITNNISTANNGFQVDLICTGTALNLNGVISGAGAMARGNNGGAGLVVLNGANTFSGGLTNVEGPLVLGNPSALGTGTFVSQPKTQSATLSPMVSANTDLSGANAIANAVLLTNGAGGANFIINGTNNIEFSGPVTLGASPVITNNNTGITKFSGAISGTGFGLGFAGSGTTIMAGTSTYTGPTSINAGTVQVDGNISASSSLTVAAGATLKGNGTVPATTINGNISPGASPGTLTTGDLTWNTGGSYVWEVNNFNGTAGANPGWDLINANSLTIAGTFTVKATALNPGSDNFDSNSHFDRVIVHTVNGITGDLSQIAIDSSSFDTLATGGTLLIAAVTNIDNSVDLVLQYRFGAGITGQPSSATVCGGGNALFGISPNQNSDSQLTYQWQKNGVNLVAGTQPSGSTIAAVTGTTNLIIQGVQPGDEGNYSCVVTGPYGTTATSSAASLTVPVAPVISAPASASTSTVNAGDAVNLTVSLSAGNDVTYQWKKGGVNLANGVYDNGATVAGSTTTSLTLTGVRAVDSGDYTCSIVATGGCGSALSPATTVVVVDPYISVQPVSSTFECSSSNALTVTAIGTTNANGVLTYQWYTPDPSGSVITDATNSVLSFPNVSFANGGSYSVVVSNALGNSITSAVVVVTVEDTNAPVISVIGGAATAECHGSYSDAGATATDGCDGSLSVTTSGLPDVNTVGNYTVTYTATDSHGNSSTATRLVTIQDTTAPTLSLNGSAEVTISCGTPYTDAGASASDVCAGDLTSQVSVNFGGLNAANPSGGDYTVTYNVQDPSGNAATPVSRLVHVVDTVPPTITITGANPATVECHSSYTDAGATASDNCAGAVTPTTTGSVNPNVVGTYTLTYTATDGVNTSTATRVVNVTDTTAPVVTLSGAAAVTAECHGSYTDPGASASDDCDANASVTTSGTVDLNTVGVYTRTYTATDASGNHSSTTRQITVSDSTAPVITVTGSNPATVECHGSYTDAGATATDTCDSNPTVTSSGTVDTNTPGSYTITYTATDASNNSSTATRVVNVGDSTAPVVTLNGASTIAVECHTSFTDPGATASDACDTNVTVTTSGAVDVNTPGSYTLTYSATDASNNTGTAARVVNVSDTAAPVLSLNGSASITVECHSSYTEPGATANDACEGPVSVNIAGSVDANTVGDYTLTYSACDSSSHCASITRVVHVADSTPPVVTVTGGNQTVECHSTFTAPGAPATDTCSGDLTANIQVSGGPVDANTVGSYTLTYTATDAAGNSSYLTRTVTVADSTPPVVTVTGGDQTVECHGSFTDAGATASDACAGDLTANIQVIGSVDANTVGSYTLTYTVTDPSSNAGSATRVVTVQDTTAPVITLNGANPDSICQFSSYTDPGATANDACTGSVNAIASGNVDINTVGAYTLTYTATDASGNTATATRVVNVTSCGIVITQQPQDANVNANDPFTLTVVAAGGDTNNPITYQWKRGTNGVPIVDATNASYSVDHAFRTNADIYFVDVTSGTSTITSSNATVTVQDPVFTINPASTTAAIGLDKKITLVSLAQGTPTLKYQWYFHIGTHTNKLATTPTLTVAVGLGAAGDYFCVVTNVGQKLTATSSVATVTIYQAPTVTAPAKQVKLFVGQNATFKVAGGPANANKPQYGGPISYQWVLGTSNSYTPLVDGGSVSGTTTPILSIQNVQLTDAGSYSCYVYNNVLSNGQPVKVFSKSSLLIVNTYTNPPVVVIVKPGANARTNSPLQVYGTATDKGYVTNVALTQITTDVTNALVSGTNQQTVIYTTNTMLSDITYKTNGQHQPMPGNVTWTNNPVTLNPGTNALIVTALDDIGNVGTNKPVRNVFSLVSQSLTVTNIGSGSIQITSLGVFGKPVIGTTTVYQNIGYTLKAVPKAPHVFVNWTDGDGNPFTGTGIDAGAATLHFMMPGTNLTIHANFN